jgi:hypothetical protein
MTTLEHGFSLRAWARNPVNLISFVTIWGGFPVALVPLGAPAVALLATRKP